MLNQFIGLELNSYSKTKILETVEKAKKNGIENVVLTFNIYSITINPSANEVVLSNDIVFEIPDEVIPLDKFRDAINRFDSE